MTTTGSIVLKRNKEEHLIFEITNGYNFFENETHFEIIDAKGKVIHQEEINLKSLNPENSFQYDFAICELELKGKFRLIVSSTIAVENFLIRLSSNKSEYLSAVLF